MMKIYLKKIFALILITCTPILQAAEFEVYEAMMGNMIRIDGEIVKGDYKKFTQQSSNALSLSQENKKKVWVSIHSRGGDLLEAMKIGEAIREMRMFTNMRSECLSACFFILVAGVHRAGPSEYGKEVLGVHRPYFEPKYFAGLTSGLAEEKYNKLLQESSRYLRDMNVSDRLIYVITSIPSGDMLSLSSRDYTEEVGLKIPYWEEWITSKCGSMLKGQELDDYKDILGSGIVDQDVPFSSGYVDYLKSKVSDQFECGHQAAQETQMEAMRRYLK